MSSEDAPPPIDFRLERTIRVRRGGQETSGPLTVGPIRWLPERKSWACYWSIHVIHPEEGRLYGDDPMQALDRTFGFLADLINGSIEDGFEMWWQHEGDACGFRLVMWWTGIDAAKASGFVGFQSICDLRRTNLRDVPKQPGVYLILRTASDSPTFLGTSTGGHFKGKDPTAAPSVLEGKWVTNSAVVYVGKAGGDSEATLQSRLKQYLRFGEGKPVGHWGGRYIWQVRDCESLLVCWKTIDDEAPVVVEQRMLDEFAAACGRLPFANCRR